MNNKDLLNEQVYDIARADEFIGYRAKALLISRRRLVQLLAAGASAATAGLLPLHHKTNKVQAQTPKPSSIVKPTPSEFFVQNGSNLEMRWEALYNRGYLVPTAMFFVRNNNPTPQIDLATWQLKIEGSGVERPKSFTYDEILSMPSVSVIRAIECAGNGRNFFEKTYGKKIEGTPWNLGGIGVAEWTGVPLGEVLKRVGLKRTARDVMPISLDEKKIQRPFSIEKALEEDTLLVYAMNGDVLPIDHGFPMRVLVPGWVGIAHTKWVGSIQVSQTPLFSTYNTKKYVLIGEDYPVPEKLKVQGVMGQILTTQKVKSAFELPWDGQIKAGKHLIRGRSWSGEGKITKVEVSLDNGKTWQTARLREPNIASAWVRWDLEWDVRPGSYGLRARATDSSGNTQPDKIPWNDEGYSYWAVVTHPIKVV
ncbi:sulfite oxidase [Fischerella sp. PCC 9605]|uniref:sulfite oxidase n=1 Tax=Fischerella sp. PCC 9605 TaxID=1173024 RepID=UPI00047B21DC|nr:sulfite oxidase [Fischerella sp. PCC 9605]